MGTAPKVVFVICVDRTMQISLRTVVEEAGCRATICATVAAAARRLARTTPALILVDPLSAKEASAIVVDCPVVTFPVRTSSTGVRRIAKRNDAAVKWLSEVISTRCSEAP